MKINEHSHQASPVPRSSSPTPPPLYPRLPASRLMGKWPRMPLVLQGAESIAMDCIWIMFNLFKLDQFLLQLVGEGCIHEGFIQERVQLLVMVNGVPGPCPLSSTSLDHPMKPNQTTSSMSGQRQRKKSKEHNDSSVIVSSNQAI